ncbi:hypothetical protein L7F22_059617 [Adiantum nelumboides]|nr:hypothetical protein [Adiantum nelumboides]
MLQHVDPSDVDFLVPIVVVVFQGMLFEEVMLDGGLGVNILPEEVYRKLKLGGTLSPTPFQVKMADQRRVQPLGILKQQAIEIASIVFFVNFVVLRMKDPDSSYKMLLGRPWFRQARVKQDWGENVVMLRKGKQSVTISMQSRKQIPPRTKPLCAQTINLAYAVEDDEEEEFLRANPIVVPVFEVDVEGIIQKDEDQGEDEVQKDEDQVLHYLLNNWVMFHVDHQALLYLVKKPMLTGSLARH